jgi:hypothetical protein
MSALIENVTQPTEDFNNCVESLVVEQKSTSKPEPQAQESTKNTKNTMAAILLELTTIAAQLAQVDMTMAKVNDGAPEDEEAKRWHEISVQALRTTRNMLAEKQSSCLNELCILTGATPKTEPTAPPAAPKPESAAEKPEPARPKKEPAPKSGKQSTWDNWSSADVDGCPEFVPPPPGLEQVQCKETSDVNSLRQDLEMLRQAQPETVIIVRRIKKLGFESPQMLRQHFAQYGRVSEILVAHSHVKPTPKRPNGRVRPAALGFAIMGSPEAAQKAFKAGAVQNIGGNPIELGSFESFDNHYNEEGAADES